MPQVVLPGIVLTSRLSGMEVAVVFCPRPSGFFKSLLHHQTCSTILIASSNLRGL